MGGLSLPAVVLIFVASIGPLIVTFSRRAWLEPCFVHGSYYLLTLLVLLWAVQLWVVWRETKLRLVDVFARYWIGLLVCAGLVVWAMCTCEPQLRVLSDETNLLSVSRSMYREHTIYNVTAGTWYYELFHPLEHELPIRPFVFAYFVNLVHTLRGFAPSNVFIVNALAFFALLVLLFITIRSVWGQTLALATCLLVCAQPIVLLCATSGGFDMIASLFLAVALVSANSCLRAPTPSKVALLWLNLLMLAQTRHESAAYALIILFLLVAFRAIRWRDLRPYGWLYALSPLLLLPLIWLRWFTHTDSLANNTGERLFSRHAFLKDAAIFVRAHVTFPSDLPYAFGLHWLAFAALGACLYWLWQRRTLGARHVELAAQRLCVAGACILTSLVITLAHFFGRFDHPTQARIFLPFAIAAAVLPACAAGLWRVRPAAALWVAGAALAIYAPTANTNAFLKTLTLPREFRFVMEYLNHHPDQHVLVIADTPGIYAAQEIGAVGFGYANQKRDQLVQELDRRLYTEILVVQNILYADDQPSASTRLKPPFVLEPVADLQNTGDDYIRIARVIPPRESKRPPEGS
jgi:hypothetical protein